MKLNVFYGDTKHGNVVDCDSFEDAEKLIRESAGKGFANIVLNDKKYPQMQIKINGDLAFVMYDGAVGECIEEFDDCADDDADDDVKAELKPICSITTTSISRRGFLAVNKISPLNF